MLVDREASKWRLRRCSLVTYTFWQQINNIDKLHQWISIRLTENCNGNNQYESTFEMFVRIIIKYSGQFFFFKLIKYTDRLIEARIPDLMGVSQLSAIHITRLRDYVSFDS